MLENNEASADTTQLILQHLKNNIHNFGYTELSKAKEYLMTYVKACHKKIQEQYDTANNKAKVIVYKYKTTMSIHGINVLLSEQIPLELRFSYNNYEDNTLTQFCVYKDMYEPTEVPVEYIGAYIEVLSNFNKFNDLYKIYMQKNQKLVDIQMMAIKKLEESTKHIFIDIEKRLAYSKFQNLTHTFLKGDIIVLKMHPINGYNPNGSYITTFIENDENQISIKFHGKIYKLDYVKFVNMFNKKHTKLYINLKIGDVYKHTNGNKLTIKNYQKWQSKCVVKDKDGERYIGVLSLFNYKKQ